MEINRIEKTFFTVICIKDYIDTIKVQNFTKNSKYDCMKNDSVKFNGPIMESYIIRYFVGETLFIKKDEIFKIKDNNLIIDTDSYLSQTAPLFVEYFISLSEHRDKQIDSILD